MIHSHICSCSACGDHRDRWDARHMALAIHVSAWSKDPSTKVGAVLVGKNQRDIALGYNGFPPGIGDSSERLLDRRVKYLLTQHAERNVLDNARFEVSGSTLITTAYPCVECAKSIVSKGVSRLVTTPRPAPIGEPSWRDTLEWSENLFREAGLEVRVWDSGIAQE